jgi:Predicted membrane protein (DUF2207) C-terminal domain
VGSSVIVVIVALATSAAWLVAAGAVFVSRRPPEPPVGPRTLELGPEPPAVANFLVHDFRVSDDAVPATLIDLAARNVVDIEQRGPGVFYVRLRTSSSEPLTSYERRILAHLHTHAVDGVVPAGALTTGPQEDSKRWMRGFTSEVVADAKGRGLSRDAVDGPVFTLLTGAAVIPALLAWAAWEFQAGLLVIGGAVALLSWIRARHPQRETPAGMEAASRWLGVRAKLEEDEEFARQSPLTVELWDRLLAYGAALDAAGGSSRPLPMGVESDTQAWSAFGGRWRAVRISYPRLWPPLWGVEPLLVLGAGVLVVVGSALFLYFFGPLLVDAGIFVFAALPLGIACGGVILGVALVAMGGADWRSNAEVTGPILRLRTFGDDKKRRYYAAVDDGESRAIRAWRVSPNQFAQLEQGQLVTVRFTPNTGCVRWLVRADDPEGAAG